MSFGSIIGLGLYFVDTGIGKQGTVMKFSIVLSWPGRSQATAMSIADRQSQREHSRLVPGSV